MFTLSFDVLGAIVVALSAFGGIPYLPGFDVGDYSSSQLRTPKKPFDFAKVIDSGGSLNEIVWTNPVYNTGIWYLAVGGKDGIAADFEIKIVASGKSNVFKKEKKRELCRKKKSPFGK